jgi:hypothetical protein
MSGMPSNAYVAIAVERDKLQAQRDALLAAAKEVNSYAHDWSDIQYEAKAMERLRQAIAEAEKP